jgi:hypothetical protein
MLTLMTEQELEYGRLVNQRITDLEQWQAVHRLLPANAEGALRIAMLRLGWNVAVDLLLLLTETPAQTATRLGGLVDYSEKRQTAVFAHRHSAEVFSKQYPTWTVEVEVKGKQTA